VSGQHNVKNITDIPQIFITNCGSIGLVNMEKEFEAILLNGTEIFHPGLSIDCAIFGFHENQLKVLLLQIKNTDFWALPGGFIYKDENLDDAANRLLSDRTGLDKIFLRQFYVFGNTARHDAAFNRHRMQNPAEQNNQDHWFLQRFITVGYYALVDFSRAIPRADYISEACVWWDLQDIPPLMLDHRPILNQALETLRLQLNYQPIGLNLLPEKFTMPELQKLYETILGKKLDRRNFSRKMLGYGILNKLEERKDGMRHKSAFLYRFDPEKYNIALQEGLNGGW
jgi:8-oxo-dGTP diphosphatase